MSLNFKFKYDAMLAMLNMLRAFEIRPTPMHIGKNGPMTAFRSGTYHMYVRIVNDRYELLRYSKGGMDESC